ncbi:MAG TPA: NAD(P)-binding protein [Candidatus Methylomirabilis sp.]|nr:NAD(P)-binding protein [Candidatus Methylomirabilis sp.]
MRREIDCLIVGSGLGGLTCGTILARRGRRVLLLTRRPLEDLLCWVQDRITHERSPELWWGFEDGGPLQSLLAPGTGGPGVVRVEPGIQVVLPRHRVSLYMLGADWERELRREFSEEGATILRVTERLCRLAARVPRDMTGRFGRIGGWDGAWRVGRLSLRAFLRRYRLATPFCTVAEALAAACFRVEPGQATVAMASAAFGHAQRGLFAPQDGVSAFTGQLVERFRRAGGEIDIGAVGEIKSRWGTVQGVTTTDGEVMSCRHLVWEPEPGPEGRIFHLLVDETLIPGEFAQHVLLVETDPGEGTPVALLHVALASAGTRDDAAPGQRAVVVRILQGSPKEPLDLLERAFPGWAKARVCPASSPPKRSEHFLLARRWLRPRNLHVIRPESPLGRGAAAAAWNGHRIATRLLRRA